MMGPLTKKGAKLESRGYEVDIWWYLLEPHVPPKKTNMPKKNTCKHEKIVDIKWTAQVFARTNRAKHTVINAKQQYHKIIQHHPQNHESPNLPPRRKKTNYTRWRKQTKNNDRQLQYSKLLASKMDTVESSKKLPVRSWKPTASAEWKASPLKM